MRHAVHPRSMFYFAGMFQLCACACSSLCLHSPLLFLSLPSISLSFICIVICNPRLLNACILFFDLHACLPGEDDDNAYDPRLFEEILTVKRVGVWPVGLSGGRRVEYPVVDKTSGKVIDFRGYLTDARKFPVDMAAFAVNAQLLLHTRLQEPVLFVVNAPRSMGETMLLEALNLEVFALLCKVNLRACLSLDAMAHAVSIHASVRWKARGLW